MTTTPPTSAPEQAASLEHLLLRFGLITLDQLSAALREQTELGTPFTESLVRDGLLSADDLARVADRAPAPAPTATPDSEPDSEPLPPAAVLPGPIAVPEPAPRAEEQTVVVEQPVFAPDPAPVEPEPVVSEPAAIEPVASVPEPPSAPPAPVALAVAPETVFAPETLAPVVVDGYVVRGRLVNGEEIEIASVEDAAEAQRIARDAMRACSRQNGADWPVLSGRYVRPESIVSIEVAERF